MVRLNFRQILRSFDTRLFVAVWIVYALHVVPGGGAGANRYFDLTHSMVNEHSITIDAYHENTIDKGFKDGHYYSVGLPGPSVLGIPAYLAFKAVYRILPARVLNSAAAVQSFKQGQQPGFYQKDTTEFFLSTIWITWFTLSLLAALAAVLLFKLLLGLGVSRANSLLTTFAYAFATPVFFYSTTYFNAGFGAAFTIFSLYGWYKLQMSARTVVFFLLGLLVAAAVLMEYQALFLAGALSVSLLWKWRQRAWAFFAGAAIPAASVLVYNIVAFGGPFHSAYQYVVGPNAKFHNVGALGFTVPRLDRLFGLTFATHRGLFVYSPILLISIIGFVYGLRKREHPAFSFVLISLVCAVSVWLWIASFEAWDGSSAFGPRLLVSIIPFLAIGLAFGLSKVPRFVSVPLFLLSLAINWLGAQSGFAENIREPFVRFAGTGFTLPALAAISSHARADNAVTSLIANHMWLLTLIYAAVVAGCLVLVFRSELSLRFQARRNRRLAESQV